MHECFFGTKNTHWPSFLSRGGRRRGSVERLVVVGKNSWQGGGSSANWQGGLHQLGGGYYCRHRRGKKNRGRLSRFQTVAIDTRPWSQGLGGLNDQGADRKGGTIYFSQLTLFCRLSSSSQPQLHQLLCCRPVAADMVECCFSRLSRLSQS